MFQYYFKIIPTMYVKLDKSVVYSNQFSVTRHQKTVQTFSGESGMPGAFFSYELSPLMVKYTERERYIKKYLTFSNHSFCIIILKKLQISRPFRYKHVRNHRRRFHSGGHNRRVLLSFRKGDAKVAARKRHLTFTLQRLQIHVIV